MLELILHLSVFSVSDFRCHLLRSYCAVYSERFRWNSPGMPSPSLNRTVRKQHRGDGIFYRTAPQLVYRWISLLIHIHVRVYIQTDRLSVREGTFPELVYTDRHSILHSSVEQVYHRTFQTVMGSFRRQPGDAYYRIGRHGGFPCI